MPLSETVQLSASLRTCTLISMSSPVSLPLCSPPCSPVNPQLKAVPVVPLGLHPFCWPCFYLPAPVLLLLPPIPAPAEVPASEPRGALTSVGPISTGILKDYLRELPTPLITQPLYQVVLEAMARGPPSRAPSSTEGTRELLSCLPDVERVSWAWGVGRVGRTGSELTSAECFSHAWAGDGHECVAPSHSYCC